MKRVYLGVIPARGGSKRVRRKNIRMVGGKPLIHYTIEATRNSKRLDHFMVSTEDDEIFNVATEIAGHNHVIRRPDDLSGDEVGNAETLLHSLNFLSNQKFFQSDVITHLVLLHPTCPFRSSSDIDNAIRSYEASGCETLASVGQRIQKRHNVLKYAKNDLICDDLLEFKPNRPILMYNAAIYIVSTSYLKKEKKFHGKYQGYYEMSELASLDIDTELGLQIADLLMKKINF